MNKLEFIKASVLALFGFSCLAETVFINLSSIFTTSLVILGGFVFLIAFGLNNAVNSFDTIRNIREKYETLDECAFSIMLVVVSVFVLYGSDLNNLWIAIVLVVAIANYLNSLVRLYKELKMYEEE